jgi:hypothetical protein
MHSDDIELSSRELQPIGGFPSVADKIASDVDKTTTIYRRFDKLSARNILLLQAELAELERLQDRYNAEDRKRMDDEVVTEGQRDWREFEKNAAKTDRYGQTTQSHISCLPEPEYISVHPPSNTTPNTGPNHTNSTRDDGKCPS